MVYSIPPGNPTTVWDIYNGVVTNDPYGSWNYHVARTGRGGVDMTTGGAIALYAPMDCTVYRYYNGAGIAVRMYAADNSGWSDIFDHLTSVDVPDGTVVPFGGRVATSGNTYGYGHHLHWHRLNPAGAREIPWDYFTSGNSAQQIDDEEEMLYVLYAKDTLSNPVERWAITGPGYWTVLTHTVVGTGLAARFGGVVTCKWSDWDMAYNAAVATGFVPASGQTSRTI